MNSFKTFINKVGDRVRDVTPQGGLVVEGTLPQGNMVEGFLCPTCLQKFDSVEALKKHDEDDHINPSANYLCPVCQARLSSRNDLQLHYASNHKEKDFSNHSLELLKDELIEVTSSLREERWHSEELKKEVENLHDAFRKKDNTESDIYIHKFQLDAAEEAKTSLSSEVKILRKQLSEALQHTSFLLEENQGLESRLLECSAEKSDHLLKIEDLQTEMESHQHFKEEAHKVMEKFNIDTKLKEELEKEIQSCQLSIDEKDNKLKFTAEENNQMKREIEDKAEEIKISSKNVENLKNECNLLKDNLNTKNEELNSLLAKLCAKEKILEECQTSIQPISEDALKPENAELLQEYTDKIAHLEKQNNAIAAELEDAIKQKLDADCSLSDKSAKLAETERSLAELRKNIVALQASLGQVNGQVDSLAKECCIAKETISTLKAESVTLAAERDNCRSESDKLRNDISKLRDSISVANEKQHQLQEQYDTTSLSLHASCSQLEDKAAEVAKLKEAQDSLLTQFDEMVGKLAAMETDASVSLSERETLRSENRSQAKRLNSFEGEVATLEGKVVTLQTEKDVTADELKRRTEAVAKLTSELKDCLGETSRAKDRHDAAVRESDAKHLSNCKKIKELEAEAETFESRAKQQSEAIRLLKADAQKAEAEAKGFKDSYDLVLETNTAYHDQVKQGEVTIRELKGHTTQIETDLAELTVKLTNSEASKSADKNQISALDEKVDTLEAELAGLAGDKLELQVRLEADSDARQSLLSRCVASEKEVDRLQQEINLLRRKLEDSTAALHDLGRANQSLQIETNKLSGRKWMEDSEVPNCSKCAKNFTVTNRRHHCRNCGQIFCKDCTSKLAPLDTNKKPVRVCDNCYSELNSK